MTPAVIMLALALDGAFGDPPNRFHPVAWLGQLVDASMRIAPSAGAKKQMAFGSVLALGLSACAWALGVGIERALVHAPAWAVLVVGAVVLDMTFALRGLRAAARTVTDALGASDLSGARDNLGALCSRDAKTLDESALLSGTIASVAENANDSVVAPLFYFLLFGLPGALAFRTLNTLDAMLGYRDHREYLGKASARLDDVAGYIPARITALMLLVAGFFLRANAGEGLRTWMRDASRTPSPNGGHPMATMAGLLGIVIEKPGVYSLGSGRTAEREDVSRALSIVTLACVAFASLTALIAYVRHG